MKIKVLVVSNDSILTNRLVMGLQNNCDFVVRKTFAEGLKALQGPVFDAVLVDAELPDSDAIRTTGMIHHYTHVAPTIVVLNDSRNYLAGDLYRNKVKRVVRFQDAVRSPAKALSAVRSVVSQTRLGREVESLSQSIRGALSQFF